MNRTQRNKHFRFPAFDDTTGVKLSAEHEERELFKDFDFLTEHFSEKPPMPTKVKNGHLVADYDPINLSEEKTTKFTIDSTKNLVLNEEKRKYQEQHFSKAQREMVSSYEEKKKTQIKQRPKLKSYEPSKQPHRKPVTKPGETIFASDRNVNPRIKQYKEDLEREQEKPLQVQYSGGVNRFRTRQKDLPRMVVKEVEEPKYALSELIEAMKKPEETYLLLEIDGIKKKVPEKEKKKALPWQIRPEKERDFQKKSLITSEHRNTFHQSRKLSTIHTDVNEKPAFTQRSVTKKMTPEPKKQLARRVSGKNLNGVFQSDKKVSQAYFDKRDEGN